MGQYIWEGLEGYDFRHVGSITTHYGNFVKKNNKQLVSALQLWDNMYWVVL